MDKYQNDAKDWHHLTPQDALNILKSDSTMGLTASEAASRFKQYGPNALPPRKGRSPLLRFLDQFNHALIYILLVAAIVTACLAHWIDTGVILGVVLINALIGFIQEAKAEKAISSIGNLLSSTVTVIREGRKRSVPAELVVPGDLVVLSSGDRVPADLKLIEVHALQVDQSALTGESVPVDKIVGVDSLDAEWADRASIAHASALITRGSAHGVVIYTGSHTEIGRLNMLVKMVPQLVTPLVQQINRFGRQLTIAVAILAGLSFMLGLFMHTTDRLNLFMTIVGLFVAAVPEGLPAIVTIALAVGVVHMAKRQVIIRRLPAVETMGSVSVICTDKTGTLTHNEMTVKSIVTKEHFYKVSGVGYAPIGEISSERSGTISRDPILNKLLQASVLCNDASVYQEDNLWQVQGDPTEAALYVLAVKGGFEPHRLRLEQKRLDALPFDAKHKYMATLHQNGTEKPIIYLKGAPEAIFELCAEPFSMEAWTAAMHRLAECGERVLALAYYEPESHLKNISSLELKGKLIMLGLVGMIDPPRAGVQDAIARCQAAGIRVKMITGDHILTARAIGKMIGLSENPKIMSGHEIESLDAVALKARIGTVDIFARTTPEHKLRIVEALQSQGEIVAMTGDGVNDAPALKMADVGIAMAMKGTEIAREASEIVIVDDNFISIADGVNIGRCVYENIRKSLLFLLPTDAGEAFVLIFALCLGYELPITPLQILWVNMVTAVTLAVALAFEPPEASAMTMRPRRSTDNIIDRLLLWRIIFVSVLLAIAVFGLFSWMIKIGHDIQYVRTVTVNTLVMCEVFYLFNARFIYQSSLSIKAIFGNPYVLLSALSIIVIQLIYTYTPLMQTLFQSKAINLSQLALIVGAGISVFCFAELEKYILRFYAHFYKRK